MLEREDLKVLVIVIVVMMLLIVGIGIGIYLDLVSVPNPQTINSCVDMSQIVGNCSVK